MFRKMPLILLALIILIALLDGVIPIEWKSIIYAVSMTIKSIIMFFLPMIIFMLLFKTLARLARNATKIILMVLAAVCVSNFFSTMVGYVIGSGIYNFDLAIAAPKDMAGLAAAWNFTLPKWIANSHAMFSGVILGILVSLIRPTLAEKVSGVFDKLVDYMLKGILCIIPIFIAGFIVKLIHDKVLQGILKDYALIFAIIALALYSYIAIMYFALNRFKVSGLMGKIQNMLPAAIAGFGTMSSAAAMPLTLVGAEKNSNNPDLTRLVIPTTVNVHLIGDSFAIPIFAFAVMKSFGIAEPTFSAYLVFALAFVVAKFSIATVPGGGIIVMLPVLEKTLGFSPEMSSLITALYILFDPVTTTGNIYGNGGFAMAMSKLQGLIFRKKAVTS